MRNAGDNGEDIRGMINLVRPMLPEEFSANNLFECAFGEKLSAEEREIRELGLCHNIIAIPTDGDFAKLYESLNKRFGNLYLHEVKRTIESSRNGAVNESDTFNKLHSSLERLHKNPDMSVIANVVENIKSEPAEESLANIMRCIQTPPNARTRAEESFVSRIQTPRSSSPRSSSPLVTR
jgi:hypothetical protein